MKGRRGRILSLTAKWRRKKEGRGTNERIAWAKWLVNRSSDMMKGRNSETDDV